MSRQVEFYFDFGSPYSYLAYRVLPRIAAERNATIVWRPMLLGGVFQATGNRSPVEVPAKRGYLRADLERWARHDGVTFEWNPWFVINTLTLMRGAVGLLDRPGEFARYTEAMFSAMWEHPRNLGDAAEVASVLKENGFDPAAFQSLVADATVKERLKRATEEAVARGVFGAPTFFVGDQMFWGRDRLLFVDEALARAG